MVTLGSKEDGPTFEVSVLSILNYSVLSILTSVNHCAAVQFVVCVNQSHHILKLARQCEFPIFENICTRRALFQIRFRPQKEIKARLGDGRIIHSGPSFARL